MIRYLSIFAVVFGFAAGADESNTLNNYFSVASVEVVPLGEEVSFLTQDAKIFEATDGCDDPSEFKSFALTDDLDNIIAIGEKIWKIVEAGKPVLNFKAPTVHALPAATKCWADLENWQPPKAQYWEIVYKNAYGMKVVTFKFRMSYTAGGSYLKKGQYLSNVTVEPANVSVAWGFDFDANVVVGKTVNLGTRENPMAGMQLTVGWRVKTIIKEDLNTENFFIQGNGSLTQN